ncbi:unnamed protein product [Camellia sinensis]
MPSRQFPPQLPPPPPHHSLLLPISGSISAAFSILLLLTFCFRKLTKKRTVVSDSKPPHRFSYSALRRSTSSFSPSRLLGHGGSGSVYRGTLKNPSKDLAVKVMDVGSLQGEREYQNELSFAGKLDSDYILSAIGFSSDQKRRRMVLVYELMNNGSLQDCLFHRKCSELMEWKKRFEIAIEIAKGLEYLHHDCDPAVIHGDVKPSNILLDLNFNAKIGDFGLARLKSEDQCEIAVANGGLDGRDEDNGSIGFDESNSGPNQSPESFVRLSVSEKSPEMVLGVKSSPPETVEAAALSPRAVLAVEKSLSRKDWWWKQDNGSGAESGVVKDYVMEWIGNEIKKERPKSEWIGASSSSGQNGKKSERKKSRKRLDWWTTMDDDKNVKKKEKRRPAREWWKEEYCEELEKKKKKKQKHEQGSINDANNSENWWPMEEELNADRKKKKKRSRNSSPRSSVDWWLDGLSAELGRARRNSHDSASGEMAKSGGCSSTPSTRGTVCYIAPEYGCGGEISEKCDVYSFGVLLLVLVSGRRPLQVTGSPISEFKRANLLSWARNLARAGKLLDLVDQSIQILDKKQSLLCLTVAMLCIQKLPARRPSMKEVVGMLSGELDSPQLPVEFSPSPPSQVPFKSNKKGPILLETPAEHDPSRTRPPAPPPPRGALPLAETNPKKKKTIFLANQERPPAPPLGVSCIFLWWRVIKEPSFFCFGKSLEVQKLITEPDITAERRDHASIAWRTTRVLMLLSSLLENWETLVVTVNNSAPDGVVTMGQVTSSLLNEETRRKSASSSHSEAFVVRGQSKTRRRSKTPHNRDQSRDKSKGSSFSKKDIECYCCHEKGHMKRECRKLKNKEKRRDKSVDKKQEDTTAVTIDDLMVVCEDDCINFVGKESNWVYMKNTWYIPVKGCIPDTLYN